MKGIGEGGSLGKGVDKKRERDMIVISSATIVHNISWLYLRSSHSFFHYYPDSDLSLFFYVGIVRFFFAAVKLYLVYVIAM